MSQTIYFIHGTGVRDVSGTMQQLRERGGKLLGWKPDDLIAIEWGKAVGPDPIDISPALPPAARGVEAPGAPATDHPSALWGLLQADPYAEMRVLAVGQSMAGNTDPNQILDPTAELSSVRITNGLLALSVGADDLAAAGVTAEQVRRAAGDVASTAVVAEAAAKAGTYGQIAEAAARATVAVMLTAPQDESTPQPSALYDPAARDALVTAIADALDPGGQRGIVGDFAKRVVGEIATKVAMQKRMDFMGPLTNFIRDVSYYLQHGAKVRDFIATELRRYSRDGKVIVLAHSLGGIATVDLLADPKAASGPDKLTVDLLITVGSQSPYLYLMDSLASLSPRTPGASPFTPWLNIYNTEDLLSFCAQRVFPNSKSIQDEALHADVPFPASHSAYWSQDAFYEILRRYLPT
jgi:hypothetical protein